MRRQEEDEIGALLFKATEYNDKIKEQVWDHINKELFMQESMEEIELRRRNRLRKWKMVCIGVAVLVSGTLCAKPILSMLQDYFGQTKSQDYYNPEEDEFVNVETKLYTSDLGYTTFYDSEYFEVVKEDNREQFVARTGRKDGVVEIELMKDISYEELVEQLADDKRHVWENNNGVHEIYHNEDDITGRNQTISLCDAKELGIFKITVEYEKDNPKAQMACFYIKNQFVYLDEIHTKTIENGKNVLKFEYDKTKYELVRDTSMPDDIRLQKIGADLTSYGDIILSYNHNIDSAKVCVETVKIETEKRMADMKKHLESLKDEEERKEYEEECKLFAPVFEIVPNDLNIPAIKLKNGIVADSYVDYYIDDGKGGCYDVSIINSEADDLQSILQSIEVVSSDKEVMDIVDREYKCVG